MLQTTKFSVLLLTLSLALSTQASPFAAVTKEKPMCFSAEYSKQHLLAHPKQTVKSMKQKFYRSEDIADTPLLMNIEAQLMRPKSPGSRVKAPKPYSNLMICDIEKNSRGIERLRCGIECDGGSAEVFYDVQASADNLKQIKFINGGILMYGGCGAEEIDEKDWIFLKPTKNGDDKFTLNLAPCD
jgi:hypothetical protein